MIRIFILLLAFCGLAAAPLTVEQKRARIVAVAESQVGTVETGWNAGAVEKYQQAAGLRRGDPYCGAFVYWVGVTALGVAQNPYPKSGWSPDFVRRATWTAKAGGVISPGDAGGLYSSAKGRIYHTFIIRERRGIWVHTLEGNTSSGSSGSQNEGEGVYARMRPVGSVHAARDWFTNK